MALQFDTLLLDQFEDGSGYALDLRNPAGVKYLHRHTFKLLEGLVQEYGSPLQLPATVSITPSIRELIAHGLCGHSSPSQVESASALPTSRTFTVWLHISNSCNLSCAYCYIPGLEKGVQPDSARLSLMSVDTGLKAIRQLIDFCELRGVTRLQLKFAGGEPTLNPSLVKAIAAECAARSAESSVIVDLRMLTNGLFDHAEWMPIIKGSRIGVSISVDGAPEEHDRLRFTVERPGSMSGRLQRLGSWRRIAANIQLMMANGVKPYLLCTVTRANYLTLSDLVSYCRENKLGFRLSPVRDRKTYALPGLQEEMTRSLNSLYCQIGQEYPVDMPIERFARFAEWNLVRKKSIACGTCRSMMAIGQSGFISSCQMRMNTRSGSVNADGVATAYSAIRERRDNAPLNENGVRTGECAHCRWQHVCAGGCPEHTREVFGTVDHASPWCGLYMQLLPDYVRAVASQIKRAVDPSRLSI